MAVPNQYLDYSLLSHNQGSLVSQKQAKCIKFAKQENTQLCYKENSAKEAQVLEHVKSYERQFRLVYKDFAQRELLLYPKNECGVQKFICTTMRPTQLPYIELNQWQKCAEFVANFIQYEELDPPDAFPVTIPSPSNVLEWQYGDCFDLAIALCSILIGAGYDAYCVHGHACRAITTRDQTRIKCPFEVQETEKPETSEVPEQNPEEEWEIPVKPPLISEFLKKKHEKEEEEKKLKEYIENTIDDDAPEILPPDPWKGNRLHCWVLVKEGKRGIEEAFFIEPTTAQTYTVEEIAAQEEPVYENISFVWSDKNFWIHMFESKAVGEVNYEFYNGEDWEYVMFNVNSKETKKSENLDEENEEGAMEDLKPIPDEMGSDGYYKKIERVLDLPPPWCPKLRIDKDVYAQKTPLGEKTLFYERCKVEHFADYTQFDGLIMRITFYHDYKRHLIKEMRNYYDKRVDKLAIRRRFPLEFKTVHDFAPGCPFHWKQIVEIDSKSKITIFYSTRNVDKLMRREEIYGEKTREYFQDRDDYMIYRSWNIAKRQPTPRDYSLGDKVVITKMTAKFEKNPDKPKGSRIEKVIFDMQKKKVFVYYHYEPGSIKRKVEEIDREDFTVLGKLADGHEREEDIDEARAQHLQYFSDMEKACYAGIKAMENTLKQETEKYKEQEAEWSALRKNNAVEVALSKGFIEKAIYDRARERRNKEEELTEEQKTSEEADIDYLTPVLKKLNYENRNLNAQEAEEVRDEVLRTLRERMFIRADIIKKSLEAEERKYKEETTRFAKKGDHVTPEEQRAHDEFMREINFRIDILRERVDKHHEQSVEKYTKMCEKLDQEPILAAANQNFKRD